MGRTYFPATALDYLLSCFPAFSIRLAFFRAENDEGTGETEG
jgi:hypothetical protein